VEALEERALFAASLLSAAAFPSGPHPTSASANGQSEVAPTHSVSDNGRYTVFVSTADNVVPGQVESPTTENVFLYDKTAGTTKLVSHTAGTTPNALATTANGPSVNAVISGDGSTVLFFSFATDLIAGETFAGTGRAELYLYDVASGSLKLVSHTPTDVAPGGVVTEAANAAHPFIPPTPSGASQYVNTLAYNTGFPALGIGEGLALASISANDQYIAYISDATDLGGANTGSGHGVQTNVFLYDRAADTNTLVSHNATSLTTAANGFASTVAISADGSTIAFTDPAQDLVSGLNWSGQNHGGDELYVWSRIDNPATGLSAGQTRLASHQAGSANTPATIPASIAPLFGFTGDAPPSLSASGTVVAYYFAGNNLVTGQTGTASVLNVFRYDVANNANDLVTHVAGNTAMAGDNPPNQVASGGIGPAEATGPALSADGRFIAFANNSSNLLSPALTGQNGRDNVYLYDATTHENTLVSHADGSLTTADAQGGTAPSLSADGRYVAFIDLAYPATNPRSWGSTPVTAEVRLFDRLATGSAALAQPAAVGDVYDAGSSLTIDSAILAPTVLSADGSTLVWDGPASAVVPNDLNNNLDVFLATPNTVSTALPITDLTLTPTNNDVTAGQPVGTPVATLTTTDPNPGQTFTYTILPGPNSDLFTIRDDTLETNVTFLNTTPVTYDITVRVTDSPGGQTLDKTFTITINPSTSPPTAITLSNNGTTTAGSPVGTPVGVLTATDPNVGVTQTYTILDGPHSGLFTITGDTLRTNKVFRNTHTKTYDLQVQTTDSLGLTFTTTLTITVNPGTTGPTAITLSNDTITGAQPVGTVVGVLNTVDIPGQTFTYTLRGPNADLFTVSNGVLTTNTVFTVSAPTTYTLRVHSVDSQGLSVNQVFTITVNPAAPTAITLSNSTIMAAQPVGTVVGQLTTLDPNGDRTFTYTLSGPNADLFAVDENGVLKTNIVFAVGAPTTYSLVVRSVDDLGLEVEQTFLITVNPALPTEITLSNSTITAGQPVGTVVGSLATVDPNPNQSFTYTLSGPNAGLFTVDEDGVLRTNAEFNVTTPTTYSLVVHSVDDLGLAVEWAFTLTVYPEGETTITLSNSTIMAGQPVGTLVGKFLTFDPELDPTVHYVLTGPNADLFSVNDNGELTTNVVFAVGAPTSYVVGVQALNEDGLVVEQEFTITVNPTPPTEIRLSNSTIPAGQPAGAVVGVLNTIDPNPGQSFTYTLLGENAGLFTVDENGVLRTNAVFDESDPPATYSLVVHSVDDLGLSVEWTFTLTVGQSFPN
jgi:hypothetical protein